MSREIKFRFVDTGDGTVYQPITLVELLRRIEIPRRIVLESENGHWVDTDDFLDLFEKGELVADEYTGLKDKNGKEIYEGDIVQCGACKGKVHYSDGVACYCVGDYTPIYQFSRIENESCIVLKVIGNIHENPELLDVKKEG